MKFVTVGGLHHTFIAGRELVVMGAVDISIPPTPITLKPIDSTPEVLKLCQLLRLEWKMNF